jgi:competence protein ComEC
LLLGAAGFALGILDARWVWHPPLLALAAACLAALLVLFSLRRAEKLLWLPLLLLWFVAGQFCAWVAPVQPAPATLLRLADGLQRNITGTVTSIHPAKLQTETMPFGTAQQIEQTEQIDLAVHGVEEFTADRDWQTPLHGGLRLTVYAKPGEMLPRFHCGEMVQTTLRFHPPERYLDPGAWNYPAYLADHGIAVLGSVDATRIQSADSPSRPTLACLATASQTWAAGRLDRISTIVSDLHWLPAWLQFSPQDSGIFSAMLFGDRTRLRHSLRTAFERTGSFHLLVVSGLHITILIGLIFWLARKLRFSPGAATLASIVLAIPYAFLTGFAPPVQRALWLSAVYLVSRFLFRERAALNAIGIAAIGVLVLRPASLFDTSFQMTFLAVLVIAGVALPIIEATISPYLRGLLLPRQLSLDPFLPPRIAQMRVSLRMLAYGLRPRIGPRLAWRLPFSVTCWGLRFIEALIVALLVELAMVLPMAANFHRITLAALPANLLGLPLLGLLLPLAMLTFLVACIYPAAAVPLAAIAAAVLHAVTWLIHFFGRLSFSGLRTPDPPLWAVLLFAVVWIVALWTARLSARWKWATVAAVAAASLLVLYPAPPAFHKGVLEVTAIDVGQGDSLLVVTPDGRTLLVDAGGPIGGERAASSQFDVGEDVVSEYLWHRRIRGLDAVALTHAHSDHMGGMPAILRNFHPRTLWVGKNPPIPDYESLLAQAAQEKIPVRIMTAGLVFPFGGARVRILAPAASYQPGDRASNDDSLVMRVRYRKTAALLEGDAEAPVEEQMVAADEPLAAGLLKVGHHGSSTSTTPLFLAAVHPEFAVISVGRRNPFGHPRVPVLDELGQAHVRVYRTDTLGLSSFLLNGSTIQPIR